MKSKILILGAGHLTTPLIFELSKNYNVLATRSTESKLATLSRLGAKPLHYQLGQGAELLPKQVDTLIISTPPREGLEVVFDHVNANRVIFISSTSVYGEQGICDEKSPLRPNSPNGVLLAHYESKLKLRYPNGLTLIRPGGLIDKDRHPGKFLSGKILKDPWERIHLIHEDAIRWTIKKLISTEPEKVPLKLNLIYPDASYKYDFYSSYCESQGIPLPLLNPETSERPEVANFKRDISSLEKNGFLKSLPLYPIDGRQS